jgi:predicted glycogen debranching enzyme
MTMLTLGKEILQDVGEASLREWLVGDGLGGYACSTVLGLNTRREHGLLVVATRPPVERMVLLSRVEEALSIGDSRQELGTNAYPGGFHPEGYRQAVGFAFDPLPTLTWETLGGTLSRTVARVHGVPATVVAYRLEADAPAVLELRPLLAYRELEALQRENTHLAPQVQRDGQDVVLRPYPGCPSLVMRVSEGRWDTDGLWYRKFEYARDREAGREHHEDLFSYGLFQVPLAARGTAFLIAWAGAMPPGIEGAALLANARKRVRSLGEATDGLPGHLRRAADAFLVRRGTARTIASGYPAGTDRGRDAMAALPGLCLATGRHEEARGILNDFVSLVESGALPHPYPENGGPPRYESPDAALWLILAVERYREATGDIEFVRSRMQGAILAILEAYRSGTRHGFGLGPDGLLIHDAPHLRTWADGAPRAGAAVEVQALWYNALLIGAELGREAGQSVRAAEWSAMAARTRESFLRGFWSETRGYLADVVKDGVADLTLRPSQLYAIGLPHSLLPRDKAQRTLEAVKRLVTPVGLRSLPNTDPRYGLPAGGAGAGGRPPEGAAWPHLIAIYFDALIRVHGEEAKAEAWRWLDQFPPRLLDGAVGMVPESYEGDAPHRPLGAPAQAWAVAEVLRLLNRLGRRPAHRIPYRTP